MEGINSVAYLSRVERGEQKPSKQFLEKIAQKFNVSVEFLTKEQVDKEQRINEIYHVYFQERTITKENKIFLHLEMSKTHDTKTLLKIYAVLIEHFSLNGNLKEGKHILQLSKEIIPKQYLEEWRLEFFRYYKACGTCYYNMDIIDKADFYFSLACSIVSNEQNLEVMDVYYQLSISKQRIAEDDNACLFYSNKAYQVLKSMDNPPKKSLVIVLNTLGVHYRLVGECDKALQCLDEALTIRSSMDSHEGLENMLLTNKARVYQQVKLYEQAIVLFKKQIELEDYPTTLYAMRGLIEIYREQRVFDLTRNLLEKAIRISKEHSQNSLFIEFQSIKIGLYLLVGDFDLYNAKMTRLIEVADKLDQRLWVIKLSQQLAKQCSKNGRYQKANVYYEMCLTEMKKMKYLFHDLL